MQLKDGTKRLENSIPSLPIERLKGMKGRELSLNGKNKVKREVDTETIQSQTTY